MSDAVYYSAIASREKIDGGEGVIYGVSVITMGQAQGTNSGTWIDGKTLSQFVHVASKYPDGIKVKLSQAKEHDGSAGQIVGVLKTFRVDGDRVRANLSLLKSDDNFQKILEMAQTMPSEFGLSIVIPKELEEIGGKEFLRCSEIYSVDIVSAPAANPSGLFSSKTPEKAMESKIKYAKGDSGEHDGACECKGCMSKQSKKEMSAFVASLVGLPDTATEAEIQGAFKASKGGDVTALTAKLDAAVTKLSALESGNANALALSKKAEIDNLITEATRLGKVVPMENDDLYTVKDGLCTIKMEPAQLSKMISKLAPGKIKLSKQIEAPKTTDGKVITDRRSPEFIQFCKQRQSDGAAQLSEMIGNQARGLALNQN